MRRFKFKWTVINEGVEAVVSIVSLDFQDQGTFLVRKSKNVLQLAKYGNHTHIPFMTETESNMVKAVCEGYYAAVIQEDTFVWIQKEDNKISNLEAAKQALQMQLRKAKQEIVDLQSNKTVTKVTHKNPKEVMRSLKSFLFPRCFHTLVLDVSYS